MNKLENILNEYENILEERFKEENYKWIGIKQFQDNWNIDATDFALMLEKSIYNFNFLNSPPKTYARGMIIEFAKINPEKTKQMFKNLFDESINLIERISFFKKESENLFTEWKNHGNGKEQDKNHYQNNDAISVYLWLKYPDKYNICKLKIINIISDYINFPVSLSRGKDENILNSISIYNHIKKELIKKSNIIEKYTNLINSSNEYYKDKDYNTLAMDIGYYIYDKNKNEYKRQDIISKFKNLKWWEITALGMYINNPDKKYSEKDLLNSDIIKYAKKLKDLKSPPSIGTEMRELSNSITDYKRQKEFFIRYEEIPIKYSLNENGKIYVTKNLKKYFNILKNEDITMINEPSLNMILYGPPGTGKTYNTKEFVQEIIKNNKIKDNNFIDISDLNWYSAIALGMYKKDENGHFSVPELKTIPEIQMFYESRNNKNFGNALWLNLQTHTSPESENVKYNLEKRRKPYLFDKDENSKWYLTENGKEYIKDNLSEYLDNSEDNTKNNKFVEFITFHQSYSYEEFIEGIRPKMSNNDEEKQTLSYEYNIGIFKDMCLRANSDPDNKYVIVIDEINRGNISKIFGELITLIEKDKRITPNGEYGFENIETKNTELLIRLPYTQRFFGVPNNLYIIGTMNTADKSLALLDVALRRRFKFIPMYPQYNKTEDGNTIYHSEFLQKLNKEIFKKKKNADYLIGHSYFMSEEGEPELKDILNNNVIPLLMEYFNGKIEEVKNLLENVDNSLEFDFEYSFDGNELYYLQVK